MPHLPLFLLFLQYPLIQSSGYLELLLKSAFPLNASIEFSDDIYFPTNKRVYNLSFGVDELRMLTNIPVTFHRPATVLITSGAVEKFGLKFETIRSERWDTRVMTISPERIHLPFSGFVIDIKCDRNWYGPYCDQYCNNNLAETVNRRCTDSGTLGCPLYSYGPKCNQRIHGPECECQNKGVCVSSFPKNSTGVTVDELVCECPYGYVGKRCEQKEYEYAAPITVEMHGFQRKSDLMEQFYNQSLVVNELNVFRWI